MENTKVAQYKGTLSKYVPYSAVDPLFDFLTQKHIVKLRIAQSRTTKYGDYKCPHREVAYHQISVNGNLNSYFFLWVLLHEMAHLNTWELYNNRVQPHGREWQEQYRLLIKEYLELGCFDSTLAPMINKYISHIPLNQALGHTIEAEMRKFDEDYNPELDTQLQQLPVGSRFIIKNNPNRIFESIEKRRTRYKCKEVSSGLFYSILGSTQVKPID